MTLIDVHIICLQTLQAVINGFNNMLTRQAHVVRTAASRCKAFSRQNYLISIAPLLHPTADNRFGIADCCPRAAQRIRVRSIEEGQASTIGFIENRLRHGFIHLQAKGHGAQAQGRYFKAMPAQSSILHRDLAQTSRSTYQLTHFDGE